MTRWPPFSRQRNKASGQPAFAMAYLRGRYNGGAFTKQSTQRCAPLSPSSFVTFLDFAGLSSNLAYITSVFIGYIGTDSIGSGLSNASLLKKPEKMVEINNQRKAFLDMLAWSDGTDNGRQKTRNHGYDVIVGGELFTGLLRSPSQTCHANPNSNQQAAGRYQLLSRWWMPTAKALGLKDFSPKSQDAVALAAD